MVRDDHSSATPVARRFKQPTRTAGFGHRSRAPRQLRHDGPRRPYSVLLPVGFTMPPALPPARCALTAPFHPCRDETQRVAAVCFLWHFPWGCPRRTLSGTACPWSRTFLSGDLSAVAGAAVRPADRGRMGRPAVSVKALPRDSGDQASRVQLRLHARGAPGEANKLPHPAVLSPRCPAHLPSIGTAKTGQLVC